jgi:sensor histidine kinase YesM
MVRKAEKIYKDFVREYNIGEKSWFKWTLIWLSWFLVALFFSSQVFVENNTTPAYGWLFLRNELIFFHLWFCLTPLLIWLNRRFRVEKGHRARRFFLHLIFSLIITFLHVLLYTAIIHFGGLAIYEMAYAQRYQIMLKNFGHFDLQCYWAVFGITYAVDYYRKYREGELRASQLESSLTQSKLQMLKMQLHPHFLFNTLNTISVLMEKDVKAANRMLTRLGDLLRLALADAGTNEVALKNELDFLQRYLEIEQIRFQDRLKVVMNIEPETLDAQIPNLILQPLVENAVRHGIAPKLSGGEIEIGARREEKTLYLYVRDNGKGVAADDNSAQINEGIGLVNTKARLEQLYGENFTFRANNLAGGGFLAALTIPFRIEEKHSFAIIR